MMTKKNFNHHLRNELVNIRSQVNRINSALADMACAIGRIEKTVNHFTEETPEEEEQRFFCFDTKSRFQ